MNKVAFIIPYFGKFNNYFSVFLKSCETNYNYDWLIFTDDDREFNFPQNVLVNYLTFEEMKNLITIKLNASISLEHPYKLCDFRPLYGYIFNEYLENYEFWGYCDTDLIWGNIDKFLSKILLDGYDKIGNLGHCTIFKNTDEINSVFMKSLNGIERYKEVINEVKNCSFDEEYNQSINNIFEQYGYKIFEHDFAANIYTKSSNFRLTKMFEHQRYLVENKVKNLFLWDNGTLFRYIYCNKKLSIEEYLYIHMQSRKMKLDNNILTLSKFKIIPNKIEPIELEKIDEANVKNIKWKHFNMHYFILRFYNLMNKIKKMRIK